jgi:hypothetical protein
MKQRQKQEKQNSQCWPMALMSWRDEVMTNMSQCQREQNVGQAEQNLYLRNCICNYTHHKHGSPQASPAQQFARLLYIPNGSKQR